MTAIRLSDDLRARVDAWAAKQEGEPGRSDAIRRLVEIGLASAQPTTPISKKTAAKAAGMAEKVIDWLGNDTASPEVRAGRKRQLLKGPSELRDMRGKAPKPKG